MKKDITFNFLKRKLETEILELENLKKLLDMQFPKNTEFNMTREVLAIRADSAVIYLTKALENLYKVYDQVVLISQDINLLN